MYESIVLLCTSNEQLKEEIRKIISFAIESKRIQYLGINLTNDIQDLYTEKTKHC